MHPAPIYAYQPGMAEMTTTRARQRIETDTEAADLVKRMREGERRATAMVITELERLSASAPMLLRAMQPHLGNALVVGFTGPPGAGKSTLVNALVPSAQRAIGDVNDVTGRGRHTSTSAVALRLPDGEGWVIDTPGVRSFGLGHVDPANILRSFTDLAEVAEECPRGCTHLPDAPDCAIVEAVEEGRLGPGGPARLDSLQRLLETFAKRDAPAPARDAGFRDGA